MFEIEKKEVLNDAVTRMAIRAPLTAAKAKAGQFIIFRADRFGERVPLTVADTDPEAGTVTIIFQHVGTATRRLATMEEGEALLDFVGPLGRPADIEGVSRACVVAGGVGAAVAYPVAKALKQAGAAVDVIVGFRDASLVILEEDFAAIADRLILMTDDGSKGERGFVTDALKARIDEGADYDLVTAFGPVGMMRAVSDLTAPYEIPTRVSLNPIMVDGTGMCGGCRVMVDGRVRFACVEGPEFDGHAVDFEDLMRRNQAYADEERGPDCRMLRQADSLKDRRDGDAPERADVTE